MGGKRRRPRGRPVEYSMPEPIPDTPENIMKAILRTPPRKRENWRFVRERGTGKPNPTPSFTG